MSMAFHFCRLDYDRHCFHVGTVVPDTRGPYLYLGLVIEEAIVLECWYIAIFLLFS